jgi:predicted permease
MNWLQYFFPVFKAVSVILSVALISGILFRKKIISNTHLEGLSHIVVIILLPCLIFSKIIQYFDPAAYTYWWMLPLIAFAMIGTGLLISGILYLGKVKKHKKYMAIASFMNANYMVLPIGQLAFADQFDQFATFTFLFVLGVNPALWSLGKFMITEQDSSDLKFKQLITPPLSASLLAIFIVLLGLNKFIPQLVIEPIDFIGQAAVPAATLVLGATIGSVSIRQLPKWSDILKVVSTKLFFLPLITIWILHTFHFKNINPLLADLIVIQASVAPATQLIIQVKKYGGDAQNVGYLMLINYILCLFTIPAWYALWKFLG